MTSAVLTAIVKRRTHEAAELIATAARVKSSFSTRIPKSIHVVDSKESAIIIAGGPTAPNADPFENGKSHPLFGNREHWYKTPKRPFLAEATDAVANEAAEVMAKIVDDAVTALGI